MFDIWNHVKTAADRIEVYDWSYVFPGDVSYVKLTSTVDPMFRQGQRGSITFRVRRTAVQKALSEVPGIQYADDVFRVLGFAGLGGKLVADLIDESSQSVEDCADQIASKIKKEGFTEWAPMHISGDDVTVYIVAGSPLALVAIGIAAIFGVGFLVNWTIDTITVSRVKIAYTKAAIAAADEIDDPVDRAGWLKDQADNQKSSSLLDFGLGDNISSGVKSAVVLVGVAVAVVVAVIGISRG